MLKRLCELSLISENWVGPWQMNLIRKVKSNRKIEASLGQKKINQSKTSRHKKVNQKVIAIKGRDHWYIHEKTEKQKKKNPYIFFSVMIKFLVFAATFWPGIVLFILFLVCCLLLFWIAIMIKRNRPYDQVWSLSFPGYLPLDHRPSRGQTLVSVPYPLYPATDHPYSQSEILNMASFSMRGKGAGISHCISLS